MRSWSQAAHARYGNRPPEVEQAWRKSELTSEAQTLILALYAQNLSVKEVSERTGYRYWFVRRVLHASGAMRSMSEAAYARYERLGPSPEEIEQRTAALRARKGLPVDGQAED
jgi:hypothetical protein